MKKKNRDQSPEYRRGKRSSSPVATKEELASKKIELIVYVGNLPLSWNEEDITNYLGKFGVILDVKLIRKNDKFTGASLVKFKSLSDAEDAIK